MDSYALISVYDKTGLAEFARFLSERGVKILSTGGTAAFLTQQGIPVVSVSEYTGSPEVLDGRVKTLHPKIHGGILARRSLQKDQDDLVRIGAAPIDYVVVNLYPFTKEVAHIEHERRVEHESLVELIDIGGPTLIRAAAKNSEFVVPICDPADYQTVTEELKHASTVSASMRQHLAAKVFVTMAQYDAAVGRYFALHERLLTPEGEPPALAPIEAFVLERQEELRYGENPHQSAALYRRVSIGSAEVPFWTKIQGKELSYNNLVDLEAATDLLLDLRSGFAGKEAAVIIKHTNPCGAAIRESNLQAFQDARSCDPVSAFGGIVAVTGKLDAALASSILEGFVEVVAAKEIDAAARQAFTQKKNVRLIECDFDRLAAMKARGATLMRPFWGGFLIQTADAALHGVTSADVAVGEADAEMVEELRFAWIICKHVKSNAIVVTKGKQALGVGAGQMSRVDSSRLALQRAAQHGFDVRGAVAASDAFLPFPDTLEVLNDSGVVALVQPGGSLRDEEVIACAKKRGVVMLFTHERHFRH